MTHKADSSFFGRKRWWSRRKDGILDYYLVPYLPKVATQGRPIAIIDGFAGPGAFEDGEPGSPLIICNRLSKAMAENGNVRAIARFVERDNVLHDKLRQRIGSFPFAQTHAGDFLNQIDWIESLARTHSVFLYLDPFTVEGIDWTAIDRVLKYVNAGQSIELLLNWNVHSFGRRGRAALRLQAPDMSDQLPSEDWEQGDVPEIEFLNRVVGGDWWQPMLRGGDYATCIRNITGQFVANLKERFHEVCVHEVMEKARHTVPKYVLVFCSRHPDALVLMNDAMVQSRDTLAEREAQPDTLFETRPASLVPDAADLARFILAGLDERTTREKLVAKVVRENFCTFSSSDIKKEVSALIKSGRIASETGKSRVNDSVLIWRTSKS